MARYHCVVTRLNPSVDAPREYADLSWLADRFDQDSSGAIRLDFDNRSAGPPLMNNPSSETSDYELQLATKRLIGDPAPGAPVDTIAIIIANTYCAPQTSVLGVMFDTSDNHPRQACAIFAGALARSGRDAKFSTIHEMGHLFNLVHQETPLSYMHTSPEVGPAPTGWRQFCLHQKSWLADCDTRADVWPGGAPFRGDPHDRARVDPVVGADFSISTSVRSFSRLEPIELDVRLSLPLGVRTPLNVPHRLDPGCPGFRIWITTPNGERRRYAPKRVYHADARRLKINAKRPFTRDISLWRSSGGFTFSAPGVHEIVAEFDIGRGLLRSNTLAVEILPDRAAGGLRERLRLIEPSMQDFLYYRDRSFPHDFVEAVSRDLKDRPKQRHHVALRYALARIGAARIRSKRKPRTQGLRRLIEPALAQSERLSRTQVAHLENIYSTLS